MASEHEEIPIWFFIGSLVLVYGIIILGVGIYHLIVPPEQSVFPANLHADLWWGILMIGVGLIYGIKYCPFKSRANR
jgi:hypothetical protein